MSRSEDTREAGNSLKRDLWKAPGREEPGNAAEVRKGLQMNQESIESREAVVEVKSDLQKEGMPGQENLAEAKSGLKRDLLMGLTEHCVSDFISNQKGRTG